jgi:hypothetical protein
MNEREVKIKKEKKTEKVFCLIKKTEEVFVANFTMQNDQKPLYYLSLLMGFFQRLPFAKWFVYFEDLTLTHGCLNSSVLGM